MKLKNSELLTAINTIGLILPTVKDNKQTYDMLSYYLRRLLTELTARAEPDLKEQKAPTEPTEIKLPRVSKEEKRAVSDKICSELDFIATANNLK